MQRQNKTDISVSIGLAGTGPEDVCESNSLIKSADALMYKAKAKAGKMAGYYISQDNSD